jgi:hypothetical protein
MNGQYKVWLERKDYRTKSIFDGEIMNWSEIQQLLGAKLLECNKAEMHPEGTGYELYGSYQAASGEFLPFKYSLSFEIVQGDQNA